MSCCAPHAEADLDHKPLPNWDTTGDCDYCLTCGLAVTGLGERHGFDDEPDGHPDQAFEVAMSKQATPEALKPAEASLPVLPCGCVPPCEGHHEDES